MTFFVTVTSQGQISIPAVVRRKLGFDKSGKVMIQVFGDRIELTPAGDVKSLRGVFRNEKKITFKTIRKSFEQDLARGEV